MPIIRIMLVDDQMLLREGLKTIINTQSDMQVSAEAENGAEALKLLADNHVDLILMDIRMPILNGVEATKQIRAQYPDSVIVILTTFDEDDYIVEALANGAVGYLLKDIDAQHLLQAIRDAVDGSMMLPSRVAAKLASYISNRQTIRRSTPPTGPMSSSLFTEREQQMGHLMIAGYSNRQIANELFLTEGTVKNYVSEIYGKLGTNNRGNAVMLLRQVLSD